MDFAEAARALACDCPAAGSFQGVTTDSRAVEAGMLFAALPGARADGHDFVAQAAAAGAAAVLVSRPVECDLPQFRVDDVLPALGRLAAAWRDRVDPRVVAITGSNGKTTTKEMLAGILAL
ncbi:MAG: Mur ligase domain-containing protein, partial [Gammaproteobacteria bacterium]